MVSHPDRHELALFLRRTKPWLERPGAFAEHATGRLPTKWTEELLFWRTRAGAEVDFVLRRGEDLVAVEVKAAALRRPKLSRSARSFIEAYPPRRFLVLHTGATMQQRHESTTIDWVGPEILAEVDL